jgi:exodeoxyribonuclease-1
MNKIVFFDFETSGLNPEVHEITQVAACAVDIKDWEIVEEFECKVEFDERRAEPRALKINHYDPEVWGLQAINEREAFKQFDRFLRRHGTVQRTSQYGQPYRMTRMAGHRSQFDTDFLRQWYIRFRSFQPAEFLSLCTLQLAMWYDYICPGDAPVDYKLVTLCAHYGIELSKAHDALSDVRATVELARLLGERVTT